MFYLRTRANNVETWTSVSGERRVELRTSVFRGRWDDASAAAGASAGAGDAGDTSDAGDAGDAGDADDAGEGEREEMEDACPFDVDEDPFCCVVTTELLMKFDAAKFALVQAEERACGCS